MKSPMTRKVAIAGALIAGLSASAAVGQSSDDPVLVRQLAERALSGNFGGNVTLLPGKLVDTQPPLAVPPGWKLIGSISSSMVTPAAGNTLTNSSVFLDGQGTPDEAVAALKATLVAVGWKPLPVDNGFRGGGFVAPNQTATANAMLCGNDNTYANIGASTGSFLTSSMMRL